MTPEYLTPAYYRDRRPPVPAWPDRDPIPEVTTRDLALTLAGPHPAAVVKLRKAAERADWTTRVGYSRGPVRAVKIGTYKMVEAFGLWTSVHPGSGYRFRAVYSHTVGAAQWAWDIAIWTPGYGVRFVHATITDLHEFVEVRGSVARAWFKGIEAREIEKQERKRAAARNRTAKPKEGQS